MTEAKTGSLPCNEIPRSEETPLQDDELVFDLSPGEGPAVLREVLRLTQENTHLKARNLRVWSILLLLVILLMTVVVSGLYVFPKYRYIATMDNTAICNVSTEDRPRVTSATVTEFAKEAVVNAYSYDFINFRNQVDRVVHKYFTTVGRIAFWNALIESKNLERVRDGRLILRAMTLKVPQIEAEGTRGLVYFWKVLAPVAIEFYSGSDSMPKSRIEYMAHVTVVESPASATNIKGISIDSMVLAPYRDLNQRP